VIERGIDAVEVGQAARFSRTVAEADVLAFAEISGDRHPQHVDQDYAAKTRFGERIAHGALVVAYMSAAFAAYVERWLTGRTEQPVISYGYDKIRFIKPVRFGDTVAIEHRIVEVDATDDRALAQVTVTNQRSETVAAATHVLKFV
jgi:3-hydroxybutyryl-CoA dehydratase